jgi:hypothetical protein
MVKITKILSFALMLLCITNAFAQDDDLLKSLDSSVPEKTTTSATAFKALQVVNMQSTKTPAKKELYMIVSHRFGALGGEGVDFFDNFFGMDKATTKIGFIYGITDWFSLGVSRQTPKLYELAAKYRLVSQSDQGSFVTLTGYNTLNVDTSLKANQFPLIKFQDKLAYSTQLLASRKINNDISLQLSGIWVHKNLIDPSIEAKNTEILAVGGRYKISKRMSINAEYGYRFSPVESKVYHNPVSIGVDIDTGGHIFQLILSNSQKMNDVGYYTNSGGNIGEGGIFFGFNMYRVF